MQNFDNSEYERFERCRHEAIELLKGLHFENDPHIVLAVGDHENMTIHGYSCDGFRYNVALRIADKLNERHV